jgi:hypothetical protein
LARISNGSVSTFSLGETRNAAAILALSPTSDGIWIGTEGKLFLRRGDELHQFETSNCPNFFGVRAIVEVDHGDLWVYRTAALSLHESIRSAMKSGNHHVVSCKPFSAYYTGTEPSGLRPTPAMVRSTDDRLWLTGATGIRWANADHLRDRGEVRDENPASPAEITDLSFASYRRDGVSQGNYCFNCAGIGALLVDNEFKKYSFGDPIELPPHTRDLQFGIRVPYKPHEVRTRTRLVGYSDAWLDRGFLEDNVTYRNLGPGNYRFEVMTRARAMPWGDRATVLKFRIQPAFYQTVWFAGLCALATLLVLGLAFRFQLTRVANRLQEKLAVRLSERERIARDLHDTLLQGVQGLIMKIHAATLEMPQSTP